MDHHAVGSKFADGPSGNSGRRVGAYIVDALCFAAVAYLPICFVFTAVGPAVSEQLRLAEASDPDWGTRVGLFTIVCLIPSLFPLYCLVGNVLGRTVGKARCGLRIVTPDGAPPGLRRGALRTLATPSIWIAPVFWTWAIVALSLNPGGELGLALPVVEAVLFIASLADGTLTFLSDGRAGHDRVSGTWVTDKRALVPR